MNLKVRIFIFVGAAFLCGAAAGGLAGVSLAASGVAAVASLVLGFFAVKSIQYRLSASAAQLEETCRRLAEGDLYARSRLQQQDELGLISRPLDRLADNAKKQVESFRQQQEEIANILDAVDDGIILTDRRKNIILANSAAFAMLREERGNFTGRPLVELARNRRINEEVDAALTEGRHRESEIETGPERHTRLNLRVFLFRNMYRGVAGAVIVMRDVTRIRRLETIRSEFIENASHELRTPVSLIRGFVETLKGGAASDPAAGARFLDLRDKESARLVRLTEDILSLEEAERRDPAPGTGSTDASKELAALAASFSHAAAEKGLALETVIPPEPVILATPRGDFNQIASNLIDNAIKFTGGGKVAVELVRAEAGARLIVADSGVGIHPRDLEHIFERFYRVDKSRSREGGGTGLGLSIVRHLAEKWGGSATAESRPGRGSTFTIELPLK